MTTVDKPSFSRYLRTFGKLGPTVPDINIEELFEKRRKWKKATRKAALWKSVKDSYSLNFKCSTDVITKKLKPLRECAREIVGGEATEALVDDAAVSLFQVLLGERLVTRAINSKLVTTFGTIHTGLINKALGVVKSLSSDLNEDQIATLKAACNVEETEDTHEWEFGFDIIVPPPIQWGPPDISFLEPLLPIHKTSSIVDTFSMDYNTYSGATNGQFTSKFGWDWLKSVVNVWYPETPGGFENADICNYLASILQSTHSDDEMQGELLDMLGYDKVEMLQELMEHRREFIKAMNPQESESAQEKSRFKPWKQGGPIPRRPQLGCQVVVQSERELQVAKQLRKEEKKQQRAATQQPHQDTDSEEEFDPAELRAKRVAELTREQQRPLFGPRKVLLPRREYKESYPHVYDSQLEAKHAAAFVGNKKMMLPEGVERKDNRNYEEVYIPLPPISELPVGDELIPVSTLDDVCQLAFKGIERLNRIQSIVYETAYNTNENLLICAPTGAGKTNVALLAIMRAVKSHIVDGVINRDKFKIVYIAPMKALAAEMAKSFTKRLGPLSILVRELTGDMQLTKREIQETQVLVTTPEKWDVVTRKGGQGGDQQLINLVQLVIIDEVHLLHGDRGPVVESIVARTLRLVETTQSMIRIVGLSATLPNYLDVAQFLRVNPQKGLFYFDGRFRPVPLSMCFVGVKSMKNLQQMQEMDDICYDKVLEMVRRGHQVMVFVHTRNGTTRTANMLHEKAQIKNELEIFAPKQTAQFSTASRAMSGSRNRPLADLFPKGFAIHHAGMLRSDRNMVEKYFGEGLINVLVCTSTLAWGVNLPAHAVIIRGTEIYDAKHGSFVDLGILDVLQIFGRAGRPQFDSSGHGCIITTHDRLNHYLSLLTDQYPIESNFVQCLADNLNAEVVLGTIGNLEEAVEWLSYTYFHVRMRKNPLNYGLNFEALTDDDMLAAFRKNLIINAAKKLSAASMLRFVPHTGDLHPTDIGRTASYFYIKYDTMEIFNDKLKKPTLETSVVLNDAEIVALISQAEEFHQLKVRDDEQDELDILVQDYCELPVKGGVENLHGKVNVLIQTYLSRGKVNSFSLLSDQSFISQNAVRIARALFDMVLRQNNAILAGRMLNMAKMLQLQMWDFHHPLYQFSFLGPEILTKIEGRKLRMEALREMSVADIGNVIRHQKKAPDVKRCVEEFPTLEVESSLQPITRNILRIRITIIPSFKWNDKVHGKTSENFWVWIEDPETSQMSYHDYLLITKKQVITREPQELVATIPISEPLPSQYLVRIINDKWLRSECQHPLVFQHLILPDDYPPHTDLLKLEPLPISALQDARLESLYKFKHFNVIQTQVFHCLYHSDEHVVLGAPTGSGKTLAAELAMFRVFREQPGAKVVYIAPLKALVRERVQDWRVRLGQKLGRSVIELTGDATPDARAIAAADIVVTTPEKWDGVSRSWQTRGYVRQVALLVIDEIHLLGEERGPVLEVIVSRAAFIAAHAGNQVRKCRVVGLSTALANAADLAAWLGINTGRGLYNFRPSVRPVPLAIHIHGFPGKHYCPRMATMNKPTFQAIRQHSPSRPVLVFVSSRRQTRLTGLDLISFLATEEEPKQWLHMSDQEAEELAHNINDPNLRLLLPFGIGIHHAGLKDQDRTLVEELFVTEKIQVLIATATLAWGVNFPAHLVVVKGTEYYDGKQRRYVDMPITDVLQMTGRAGRPQFDDQAVAVLLVHDAKKEYYKKFLHAPFPVESSLLSVLPDHINAEIVAGTIQTKQEALEYLTWTYFFRRLLKNPSYYSLQSIDPADVNNFLSNLVFTTVTELENSKCVVIDEDDRGLKSTCLGRISSYYYLSHKTLALFETRIREETSFEQLLRLLSDTYEYAELPVRHNEDGINLDLSKLCPYKADILTMDNAHTKAFLLFQAHLSRLELPSSDYSTDLKSVLDQAIRIIQAMVDVCAEFGYLATALRVLLLLQSIVQAAWPDQSSLSALPHIEPPLARMLCNRVAPTLPELQAVAISSPQTLHSVLAAELQKSEIDQVLTALRELPTQVFKLSIQGWWEGGKELGERRVPPKTRDDPYIQLHADQEYVLCVKPQVGCKTSHASAPRFPRPKEVGWFMILGLDSECELLALKRTPANNRAVNLSFTTPSTLGKAVLTLYIISSCYLGIDQQYDLHIEVIEPSIEAQFNTEISN